MAGKFQQIVENTSAGLALYIGHKIGLVEFMTNNDDGEMTASEVAKKLNLKEKYVEEWLKSMALAEVFQVSANGQSFWMDETTKNDFKNDKKTLDMLKQLPMFAGALDKVSECFKVDGPLGLSYSDYPNFHMHSAHHNPNEQIIKMVDDLVATFGEFKPTNVLEIGCGHGKHSIEMAKRYPNSQFLATDLCEEPIKNAKGNNTLSNIDFEAINGQKLKRDWEKNFDLVFLITNVHDQTRPDLCLQEVYRVLKPGGRIAIIDPNVNSNIVENLKKPNAVVHQTGILLHAVPITQNEAGSIGPLFGKDVLEKLLVGIGFKNITFETMKSVNRLFVCIAEK